MVHQFLHLDTWAILMKAFRRNVNTNIVKLSRIQRTRCSQASITALLAGLQKIGRCLLMLLSKQNELQVRLQKDRGHTWWTVYDPLTGRWKRFRSHSDLLAWIENYYSLDG